MKNTTLETLIQNIDATEAEVVPKPVEHLISEIRQFYKILETEKPLFIARGLTDEFLSLGYAISDVLEERESNWLVRRFNTPEVVALWKKTEPEAYKFKSDLLGDIDLALMDNEDAQRSLKLIRKGDDTEDMLLDIAKLVTLGRTNLDAIIASGLSEEYLTTAEIRGQQLTSLFASSEVATSETNKVKDARNKAKVFTADYLSLIRKYADVIYRDDEEKRALFVSDYDTARVKKKNNSKDDEKSADLIEVATDVE